MFKASFLWLVPAMAIILGFRWMMQPASIYNNYTSGRSWVKRSNDNGVVTLVVITPPPMDSLPTDIGSHKGNQGNDNEDDSGEDQKQPEQQPPSNTQVSKPSSPTPPATCNEETIDFSQESSLDQVNLSWCPHNTYIKDGAMHWRLTQECGTTVLYPKTLKYGKVEGRIKSAAGSGVVTAFLLIGPAPSDEIDFEWVGKSTDSVQSMYYVLAHAIDVNPQMHRAMNGSSAADMTSTYHNYALELKEDEVNWYLDGTKVRSIKNSPPTPFPSSANQVRMGIWDGTHTSGWAGAVDWSKGPFEASIQWLKFTPYC
ncbi:hypothetical protein H4219_002770 [Mycoemilia scoparia]|uniref:GH16 domain-containing protein n=1 Tax=Mycoemilia scoparia TaxID=417184 RepID=A0A9W7ZXI3_9FUNG|nr:hypothetical protein H4219_002770 [Mycoemilia scoparia]